MIVKFNYLIIKLFQKCLRNLIHGKLDSKWSPNFLDLMFSNKILEIKGNADKTELSLSDIISNHHNSVNLNKKVIN